MELFIVTTLLFARSSWR